MKSLIKQKLKAGLPVFGTLISMPSPQLTQAIAACGLDWIILDMEHSPVDVSALHAMIAVTAGTDCAPLVRVPHDNLSLSRSALDSGAFGLVFPMINSDKELRRCQAYMYYPPRGERGVGPIYAAPRWSIDFNKYLAVADNELVTFVLIENLDAVHNLDSILAATGIDAAIIAPFDLSASMGCPGQYERVDVREAIRHAEETILASSSALGGLAVSADDANDKLSKGYRVLTLGYDVYLLQSMLSGMLNDIRSSKV